MRKESWNPERGAPELRGRGELDRVDRRLKGLLSRFERLPEKSQWEILDTIQSLKKEADLDPVEALNRAREMVDFYRDLVLETEDEEEIETITRPKVPQRSPDLSQVKAFSEILKGFDKYYELEARFDQPLEPRDDTWSIGSAHHTKKPKPREGLTERKKFRRMPPKKPQLPAGELGV